MRTIRMLHLVYRSFGKAYYAPVCISLLLVPALTLRYCSAYEEINAAWALVHTTMQLLLPICSIWWVYFISREYLEGDGRELLVVYQSKYSARLCETMLTWIWYSLHLTVCILIHTIWFQNMGPALLQLLAQSLFFAGIYVFLAGATGNASFSFLGVVAYYFTTAFLSQGTILEKLAILDFSVDITYSLLLERYIIISAIGLLTFLIGIWLGYRRRL